MRWKMEIMILYYGNYNIKEEFSLKWTLKTNSSVSRKLEQFTVVTFNDKSSMYNIYTYMLFKYVLMLSIPVQG